MRFFGYLWLALAVSSVSASVSLPTTATTRANFWQQEEEERNPQAESAARRLSVPDPGIRRQAAEEVAKYADKRQLKITEGYYLQEKDKNVRLAMEWALYRMGREAMLTNVIRELNASRSEQATSYLAQLETPEPLHPYLAKVPVKAQRRLLEVLARIGDETTLMEVEPYTYAKDKDVRDKAAFARREIELRQRTTIQQESVSRPRRITTKVVGDQR